MCTAVIVVSLPSLKALIVRSTPTNTANGDNGYVQTGSGKPTSAREGGPRMHVQGGKMDDEMELVFLDRKASPSLTGSTTDTRVRDGRDAAMHTTDVVVTRNVL